MLRLSLVVLVQLLACCGEPIEEYEVREGANGLVLKVKELQPITLEDGQPALYLAFQPHAPIDDAEALDAEVRDLWLHFRPEVQSQGVGIAILRASTLHVDGWRVAGDEVQYVFRRRPDGAWRRKHDAEFAVYAASDR